MILPLALVIARRDHGDALHAARTRTSRPTLVAASALVVAAFISFVLGALVGAALAADGATHPHEIPTFRGNHLKTIEESMESPMSGRRYGSECAGSALAVSHPYVVPGTPPPGASRLDRRAAAAMERREARRDGHRDAIAARRESAELAARTDIDSWLNGGEI